MKIEVVKNGKKLLERKIETMFSLCAWGDHHLCNMDGGETLHNSNEFIVPKNLRVVSISLYVSTQLLRITVTDSIALEAI